MLKYYRHQFNFICGLADLLALAASFLTAFLFRRDIVPALSHSLAQRPMFGMEYYFPVFLLTALVVLGTLFASKAYHQNPGEPLSGTFFRTLKAVLMALLLTLALAYLLKMTFMSRSFLLVFMTVFLLISTLARYAVALWFRRSAMRGKGVRVMLLAGAGASGLQVAQRVLARIEMGIKLKGYLLLGNESEEDRMDMDSLGVPCLGSVEELPSLLSREVVDGVVFAGETRTLAELEDLFLICEDLGVDSLMADRKSVV